jgi:hypothetical protein
MDDMTVHIDELIVEDSTTELAALEEQVGLDLVDHLSRTNLSSFDLGVVGSRVAKALTSAVKGSHD